MSGKTSVLLKAIKTLSAEEFGQLYREIVSMGPAECRETHSILASDAEFEAALKEVAGCTSGRDVLGLLLENRAHDRRRERAQAQNQGGARE